MRLFDKALTQLPGVDRDCLRDMAPELSVLAVDAISCHMSTLSEGSIEDYPFAFPPWNRTFVEGAFYRPDGSRSNDIIGAICVVLSAEKIQRLYKLCPAARLIGAASVVGVRAISCKANRVTLFDPEAAVFLDSDGRPDGRRLMLGAGPITREEEAVLQFAVNMSFLAFTFANCSNVKLEDSTEDLSPPPKIIRRLKLPEVKRYTLNICGHSTKPRREAAGDQQEGIMPFHLCRGHFATYTADKPLFGNPKNVGRFWIPPHTKGKKERGEIIKDYAIAE